MSLTLYGGRACSRSGTGAGQVKSACSKARREDMVADQLNWRCKKKKRRRRRDIKIRDKLEFEAHRSPGEDIRSGPDI